jgi:hypothetical protein
MRSMWTSPDRLLAGLRVAPHKADADLQVLPLGKLGGLEPPPDVRCIGRERLLGKDVDALAHGVLEHHRAEGRVRRQEHHVAGAEAIDRLAVRVEADELPLRRHVDFLGGDVLEVLEAALQTLLEQVGHRIELDRPALRRERIGHRACAAPAAADQGQPDRVALARIEARANSREKRSGGDVSR